MTCISLFLQQFHEGMKSLRQWALLLLMVSTTFVYAATYSNKSLNWADSALWYEGQQRLKDIDESKPDVFYLLPTCVAAWTDSTGTTHYNADPTNKAHLKAWQLSAELADTIFATDANLFLPYYRQATFGGLDGVPATKAGEMAKRDAIEAFDHYLTHYNHGRPIILAGYSQGGKLVTELLKHMDDATYAQLVAAYVVGYGITASDTVTQPGRHTSHVKLATDSSTLGVTINFNSVTSPQAICPLICQDNIACINPVSWTTTATPAILLPAGTTPQADDKRFPYGTAVVPLSAKEAVTVNIDPENHVLIVKGIDPRRYFLPALQDLFKPGNLHLQELFFYADHLRHNVLLRTRH